MNNTFLGILVGMIILVILYMNFKPEVERTVNVSISDTTYIAHDVVVVRDSLKTIFVPDTKNKEKLKEAYRLLDSVIAQLNHDGDYGMGYGGSYVAGFDTTIVKGDTLIYVRSDISQSIPFSQDVSGKLTIKYKLPTIHNTQILTPDVSFWDKFINRFGFYLGAGVGYDTEGNILPNINLSFGVKLN